MGIGEGWLVLTDAAGSMYSRGEEDRPWSQRDADSGPGSAKYSLGDLKETTGSLLTQSLMAVLSQGPWPTLPKLSVVCALWLLGFKKYVGTTRSRYGE